LKIVYNVITNLANSLCLHTIIVIFFDKCFAIQQQSWCVKKKMNLKEGT